MDCKGAPKHSVHLSVEVRLYLFRPVQPVHPAHHPVLDKSVPRRVHASSKHLAWLEEKKPVEQYYRPEKATSG